MVNRRVFRPGFPDAKGQMPSRENQGGPKRNPDTPDPNKKPAPLEITHAENFYWVKQMQSRTPMAIVLEDGETLRGIVEIPLRSEEHTSELQSRQYLVC